MFFMPTRKENQQTQTKVQRHGKEAQQEISLDRVELARKCLFMPSEEDRQTNVGCL